MNCQYSNCEKESIGKFTRQDTRLYMCGEHGDDYQPEEK